MRRGVSLAARSRPFTVNRPTKPDPPGPGQESVWDYPRPPALDPSDEEIVVTLAEHELARTLESFRVLETSHPPVYYLPPGSVNVSRLRRNALETRCEFKGTAVYWDAAVGDDWVEAVAWSYPNPTPTFAKLRGHFAFYPSKVTRATVDGEAVTAQPGDFYGGWITSRVVGPFKGGPGSQGW